MLNSTKAMKLHMDIKVKQTRGKENDQKLSCEVKMMIILYDFDNQIIL